MILRYVRSLATTESSPHRSWRLHYYFLSGYIIFQILQQILRDIVRGKTDKRRRKREKERKKRRWSIERKGGDFLRRRFLDRSPGVKRKKRKKKKKARARFAGMRRWEGGARAKRRRRRPPFGARRERESSPRLTNPRELKGGKERKKKARDVIAARTLFPPLPMQHRDGTKTDLSKRGREKKHAWNICPQFSGSGSIGEYWRDGETRSFRIVRVNFCAVTAFRGVDVHSLLSCSPFPTLRRPLPASPLLTLGPWTKRQKQRLAYALIIQMCVGPVRKGTS